MGKEDEEKKRRGVIVMADLADLERRIKVLEDIEAIKELKSKYWRCIGKKLWDELADCFTEDVILDMPPMPQTQGRNATVQLLAKTQGKASTIVVPQGHN